MKGQDNSPRPILSRNGRVMTLNLLTRRYEYLCAFRGTSERKWLSSERLSVMGRRSRNAWGRYAPGRVVALEARDTSRKRPGAPHSKTTGRQVPGRR